MELDLFTLVERFFTGVILFFFNVAESTLLLLRNPSDGPQTLWGKFHDPNQRQVGPNTLLLSLLLPSQMIAVGMCDFGTPFDLLDKLNNPESRKAIGEHFFLALHDLFATGEVSAFLLRPLFSALAVAVLIDWTLRIRVRLLRLDSMDDTVPFSKYSVALASLTGTLLLVVITAYLMLWLVLIIGSIFERSWITPFLSNDWSMAATAAVIIGLPIFALYKAYRRFRPMRLMVGGALFTAVVTIPVGIATARMFDRLSNDNPMAYARAYDDSAVMSVDCLLSDAADPRIDIVLYNPTHQTLSFALRATGQASFAKGLSVGGDLYAADSAGGVRRFLPLESHHAEAVTFRPTRDYRERLKAAGPPLTFCRIDAHGPKQVGWKTDWKPDNQN